MPVNFPRICALVLTALCCLQAARAADTQSYRVEISSTGDGSLDATLHATSDLESLRGTAPVSPFGLIARARADIDRFKTVLESHGYYQSSVNIQINGLALNAPGLAQHLGGAAREGRSTRHRRFRARPALPCARRDHRWGSSRVSAGHPFAQTRRTGGGRERARRGHAAFIGTQDQGYAFAKVPPPIAYEDQTAPVLDVTFHVETGPRVNIGEIHFEGLRRIHETLLRRRLLLHTGQQYSSSAVESARSDLLSMGVFAAISVQVGTAVDSTGGVPITFLIRERLRHAFGVSAAYSTDLGGSGGVTWTDRNVFGNAEQLKISASVINAGGSSTNGLGYDTSVKYILPDFGHRDQSLQFSIGAVKQFLEAYDQTEFLTGVTLTRKINKLWTVSAGLTTAEEEVIQDQPYICMVPPLSSSMTCDISQVNTVISNPVTHDYTLWRCR